MRSSIVLPALGALAVALLLTGCSGPATTSPSPTKGTSASATPSSGSSAAATVSAAPSAVPSATSTAGAASTSGSGSAGGSGSTGGSGSASGSGSAGGSGSSTQVNYAAIGSQAIAATGPGTVVQLAGNNGNWTVTVAASGGAETFAVVSQSSGRVTSGPFPKSQTPAAQTQTAALASAATVSFSSAISTASASASGKGAVTGAVLGGTAAAPTWTVSFTGGTVVVPAS